MNRLNKKNKQLEKRSNFVIKLKKLELEGHLSPFLFYSFIDYLQRGSINEKERK